MSKEASRNYFDGRQAEMYAFYRIPKFLFTQQEYQGLSSEAKLLYGIFLDRLCLSLKNGWVDRQGKAYIIFTLEEVMLTLKCANQKATRLMRQLESVGLIEQKCHARGCPKRIYVKDYLPCCRSDTATVQS